MPARLIKQVKDVAIYDLLDSGDGSKIDAMFKLYRTLLPQYQHYIPRMKRRVNYVNEYRSGHTLHYWLVEVNGKPAGFRTFRYVRGRRCGLAHSLAVAPEFRELKVEGSRLSLFIIHECLDQIVRDACDKGDPSVFGIVNEVEPERLMEHYVRNGLVQLPIKYVEPIFPPEMSGRSRSEELAMTQFSPMHLGFLQNRELKNEGFSNEIVADFAKAFLVDHYGLPEQHAIVQKVISSINIREL
jgi:hypothetical protein